MDYKNQRQNRKSHKLQADITCFNITDHENHMPLLTLVDGSFTKWSSSLTLAQTLIMSYNGKTRTQAGQILR